MNKETFLSGLCADVEEMEVEGVGTIKIRGLTAKEARRISTYSEKDDYKGTLMTLVYGIVEPQLSEEDLEILGDASIKKLFPIAERIAELSGETKDDSPTVGSG